MKNLSILGKTFFDCEGPIKITITSGNKIFELSGIHSAEVSPEEISCDYQTGIYHGNTVLKIDRYIHVDEIRQLKDTADVSNIVI